LYSLMQDPFERADVTSNTYWDWILDHVPQVYQGMDAVTGFVESFKEFPPRTTPAFLQPGEHARRHLAGHSGEAEAGACVTTGSPPGAIVRGGGKPVGEHKRT
jgi:hypothetical protein